MHFLITLATSVSSKVYIVMYCKTYFKAEKILIKILKMPKKLKKLKGHVNLKNI